VFARYSQIIALKRIVSLNFNQNREEIVAMKKTSIRGRIMYNENATAFRFKLFYLPNFLIKKLKIVIFT